MSTDGTHGRQSSRADGPPGVQLPTLVLCTRRKNPSPYNPSGAAPGLSRERVAPESVQGESGSDPTHLRPINLGSWTLSASGSSSFVCHSLSAILRPSDPVPTPCSHGSGPAVFVNSPVPDDRDTDGGIRPYLTGLCSLHHVRPETPDLPERCSSVRDRVRPDRITGPVPPVPRRRGPSPPRQGRVRVKTSTTSAPTGIGWNTEGRVHGPAQGVWREDGADRGWTPCVNPLGPGRDGQLGGPVHVRVGPGPLPPSLAQVHESLTSGFPFLGRDPAPSVGSQSGPGRRLAPPSDVVFHGGTRNE